MQVRPFGRHAALVLFVFAASIPACQCPSSIQQGPQQSAGEPAPLWESVPLKKELFPFKWEDVRHFELVRRDSSAAQNGSWAMTLEKDMTGADPAWKIAALERDGQPDPADRFADTAFVNHLVDTLSTLRAEAPVTDLDESMTGLLDPEWELRWMTEAGAAFELRLGSPAIDGTTFAQVANPRDASQHSKIFTMRGAALEMLSRVTSVDVLRLRVLTPFAADDVDVFALGGSATRPFFAQRLGDGWGDRSNHALKNEEAIHEFLEQLVHLRAKSFEERPDAAANVAAIVRKNPRYTATFTDRQGNVTKLSIGRHNGGLWGAIDGRDGVAFELYPETEKIFQNSPARK